MASIYSAGRGCETGIRHRCLRVRFGCLFWNGLRGMTPVSSSVAVVSAEFQTLIGDVLVEWNFGSVEGWRATFAPDAVAVGVFGTSAQSSRQVER